jgi:hypothetical protein
LKRLDNLQEWICDTIAPEHLRRWCTSDREVNEWYFSLKSHLGINILDRKTRARQAYTDVLTIPRRKRLSTKKEVEEWLSKSDTTYNKHLESGFEGPKEASLWFADYTQAPSNSCYESWIYSYQSAYLIEMRKNTLMLLEVLLNIRFFLSRIVND